MDLINREELKIKLDAELMDISDYLNIHEQIKDIIDNTPVIDTSDLISKSALKIAISEATYGFTEIPIRVDKVIALIDSFTNMP